MLGICVAWMMPHLIAKSSASIDVTLTTWCIVFMTGLLWLWMWDIDVATWFLMLASDTTTTDWGSDDAWMVVLSRYRKWLLILWLLFLFERWNEKWFGNTSISLFPGENSWLKGEKEGKTLLNLLSMSTKGPLVLALCLGVSLSRNKWWDSWVLGFLGSRSEMMMWFDGKECACKRKWS